MVDIDTETKLLGLIGDPVSHSLSPLMHNYLISQVEVNYVYLAFSVTEQMTQDALIGARALNLRGLNVTVPHKYRVANLVEELDETARGTDAVNTILHKGNGVLKGINTDIDGFLDSVKGAGVEIAGKRCFVFGSGGAAAAVVYGLCVEKPARIVVCNRTLTNARELASRMEKRFGSLAFEVLPLKARRRIEKNIRMSDLIVNTTSVGMSPETDNSIWDDPDPFREGQTVFDVVYNPFRTKFLNVAATGGADTVEGLDMLIFQGMKSFELWTGVDLDYSRYLSRLRKMLQKELT